MASDYSEMRTAVSDSSKKPSDFAVSLQSGQSKLILVQLYVIVHYQTGMLLFLF